MPLVELLTSSGLGSLLGMRHALEPDHLAAVSTLVIRPAVNALYGAQVFAAPALGYAPTPYAKWLTCRVAMEEYGHHVRFFELGREMGIAAERMLPDKTSKKPLSIMNYPLKTWEEFVAIKLLADLAEIVFQTTRCGAIHQVLHEACRSCSVCVFKHFFSRSCNRSK